ncbi:MAG: hypothetical protein H0V80_12055 [Acidobacteria bacterium]|nr:hypothetical protein [Acidobacteriota bacterium]
MAWLHDRALTLVMLGLFMVSLFGQVLTGWHEHNNDLLDHGHAAIALSGYFATGHLWEAIFENWESEFLQMGAFVVLTAFLVQKGSPESRRPRVAEPFDADPRRFRDHPGAPWPVRRGGWVLRLYEQSLGLAFLLLFLMCWIGHALGGFAEFRSEALAHRQASPAFTDYLSSSRFWFESFQNWQSEFLAIGAMVWLSVYLRQRGSPESKAVHASHADHD